MRVVTLLTLLAAVSVAAWPAASWAQRRPMGASDPDSKPQPPQEQVPQRVQKQFPVGASWVLAEFNGKPSGGDRPSFVLDDQYRARGFSGCNTFSAVAYPLREQRFGVGPIALTKKACDKAVMDAERAFLVAFRKAQQWEIESGRLTLRSDAGTLRFERGI